MTLTVEPARRADLHQAFRVLYQHLPEWERQNCVARAVQMVRRGELSDGDVLVARDGDGLAGAMVCHVSPGATGQVWPPQTVPGRSARAVEDCLLAAAINRYRREQVRVVQCLLPPAEDALAEPLLRHGFRMVSTLMTLRHDMGQGPAGERRDGPQLQYHPYDPETAAHFERALVRTHAESADFPELTGLRPPGELLAGYRSRGPHDPALWQTAVESGRPVAVVLLTRLPDWGEWELTYLGVTPEARGRGVGSAVLRHAIATGRLAGALQLTLAVDSRNHKARSLYAAAGFRPAEEHTVYLQVGPGPV